MRKASRNNRKASGTELRTGSKNRKANMMSRKTEEWARLTSQVDTHGC